MTLYLGGIRGTLKEWGLPQTGPAYNPFAEDKMSRKEGNPKPEYFGMSKEDKTKAYWKKSYEKHKEKRRAEGREQAKKYRKENREEVLRKKAEQWLHDNFKRTVEWYNTTLLEQGGHCCLCDKLPSIRKFQVDHDHKCCPTDKTHRKTCGNCVRGLLCEGCNTTLGYLEDVLLQAHSHPTAKQGTWLEKALAYLRKYK